jgi:hypothetical protein
VIEEGAMTMAEFISILGVAVAVVEVVATIRPAPRSIFAVGAAALALLSLITLYSASSHRRQVNAAAVSILGVFENELRTYDELRQDLYDIDGAVFDAALEQARRSGWIGFRVMSVKTPTGDVHDVRGYFKVLATAID